MRKTVEKAEKERSLFSILPKKEKPTFKKKKEKEPRQGYYQRRSAKAKEKQVELHGRPVQFEPLDYETIPEGLLILGCILEIHKYEMIISLPNRMCGVLPITNISDSYKRLLLKLAEGDDIDEPIHSLDELYKIGDMLMTSVKTVRPSATEKLKIVLSILPEDVNSELRPVLLSEGTLLQASVECVEENGFIMNTGIKNIRAAFLPFRNGPSGVVGVGSVFICAVNSILKDESSEEINIRLSTEQKHLTKTVTLTNDTFGSSVSPGTLISAQVRKIHSSGFELSIGYSVGFVNNDHLANYGDSPKNYIEGQDVVATVLYITPFTSVFHCSFNEIICQKRIHSMVNDIKIGDIVEKAIVARCTPQGVHLMLPKKIHGFCPLSKLRDQSLKPGELSKLYHTGSTQTCRIFGINYMDQTYVVALKKSIINEEVFGQFNIEIGMTINGKVLAFVSGGMTISLSETVKGFVPTVHLTDSNMKEPELKYSPGTMVKARVLKNDIGENPVLTLKSELVKMTLPIIKEYSESNVGLETKGCVFKVSETGLFVEFFGGAKAFIPKNKIPLNVEDNLDIFKEGSIVTCTITHFDEENLKMTAALSQSSKFPGVIKLRDVVSGKVVDVEDNGIFISIDKSNSRGRVPWYHLSDDVEVSRGLFSIVKKGDLVLNALVYNKAESDIFLTLKPSFFQAAKSDTSEQNNITRSEILPSVVTQVDDEILNVETYNRITVISESINVKGFVPRSTENVQDSRVTFPFAGFHLGQTLFLRCVALTQLECTLQYDLHKVMMNKEQSSFQYLYNALVTKRHYLSALKKLDGTSPFSKVVVGKKYKGKVVFVCKMGALVNIPSLSLDGVVQAKHYETKPSRGEMVVVRVLSINCEERCLELSAKKSIKNYSVNANHKIKVGEEHTCKVLLAKRDFILGWIEKCNGQVVYLPAKRHWNDFRGRTVFYEVGKSYVIKITYVQNELILADLIDHNVESSQPLQIITETPYLDVRESVPSSVLQPLTLILDRLTKIDLGKRAKQKIKKVLQVYELKRKLVRKEDNEKKLDMLKSDTFSSFNEEFYWDCKLRDRKERKKMKKIAPKKGMKKVKPKKLSLKRRMKEKVKPKEKTSNKIENGTSSKKKNVDFKRKEIHETESDNSEKKSKLKKEMKINKCEKRKAEENTSVDTIASKRKRLVSKRNAKALNQPSPTKQPSGVMKRKAKKKSLKRTRENDRLESEDEDAVNF